MQNLINFVGRMSLGERLDTDLTYSDTGKMNQNGITRCHSMMVSENQY